MKQILTANNLLCLPETEGFTRFYDELVKSDDLFCLFVEFKKTLVTQAIDFETENQIIYESIPCINIVHDQGILRISPIYLDGFENYVCFSVIGLIRGHNSICWVLFRNTLEVKQSGINGSSASIREMLGIKININVKAI
jgi:hypothetical protein